MPKKKSVKHSVDAFKKEVEAVKEFLDHLPKGLSDLQVSWQFEYAVILLYREFERLILDVIVAAINNDTETLHAVTGYEFPKHLTDEVCRYIVVNNGYFDFRGRDGLIKKVKNYVPEDHYLTSLLREEKYKRPLDLLSSMRNYAAHGSDYAKKQVLKFLKQKRIGSAGSWLKTQGRFNSLYSSIFDLATEISNNAPF